MKKFLFILSLIVAFSGLAQKKEKIKGNREVLIKKFTLPHFTALELGEHFEINLQKVTDTTSVVIETDDNLFDVIHYKVENGTLTFYTSMQIVKKKRLRITVFVPQDFNHIQLKQHAKVYNDERLNLPHLKIDITDKATATLKLHLKKELAINAMGKSNLDLDVFAENAQVYLTEDAALKGLLNIKQVTMTLDDHADANLTGEMTHLTLKIKEKSTFKADGLAIKEAVVKAFDKAETYIKITDSVEFYLSGDTETYLFGNPKIKLKAFDDNAILYKK